VCGKELETGKRRFKDAKLYFALSPELLRNDMALWKEIP
jgi:hypothetical protein